jgi:transcriptional regulator of acetoin/glycerol metabolism
LHKQLSDLAKTCAIKAEDLLPPLAEKYDSIGKIRQVIKQELEDEIVQIDRLAKAILLSHGKVRKLDELLKSDS